MNNCNRPIRRMDYGPECTRELVSEVAKQLATRSVRDSEFILADSSNVYWSGKNNNSSSVQTVTYTMPAGEHYIYAKYFKDNYTDDNNDSLQFKIAITLNEPFAPGTYWVYTLSNITADHTVVFSSGSVALPIRVKQNGSWVTPSKVLVKQSGSWIQASKMIVKKWFMELTKY